MGSDIEMMYLENRQYVFGACYKILRNPFDAEDAMQEVFLIAMKKKPTNNNQKEFRGWLNATARFECLKIIVKRRRLVSLEDLPAISVESGLETRDNLKGIAAEKTAAFIANICQRLTTQFA